MSGRVILYGASGYTGRMIAKQLAGQLDLVLAGRDAAKVRAVAEPLRLPWQAVGLDDAATLDALLRGSTLVLHAAGPFAQTALPMVDACLRSGVHYLDLGGEWPVFQAILACDAAAKAAGIMLLPGVGLTVAATDCLLARAVELWPDTARLCLGISRAQVISRGSVTTMASMLSGDAVIRRGGRIVGVPAGSLARAFDFGAGLSEAVAMSWADVVTGAITTGVQDIEVYSQLHWSERAMVRSGGLAMGLSGPAPWRGLGGAMAKAWPQQPPEEQREAARFAMVVEALDPWRRVRRLGMQTRDGYGASVLTATAAVRRVLGGTAPPGFQTPARAFGSQFAESSGAARFDPSAALQPAGATP